MRSKINYACAQPLIKSNLIFDLDGVANGRVRFIYVRLCAGWVYIHLYCQFGSAMCALCTLDQCDDLRGIYLGRHLEKKLIKYAMN